MTQKTSASLLKDTIAQALILLLKNKELDEISVSEIVYRAGVNRSTYYRHYRNKQEVVRHYYACILNECMNTQQENCSLREYFLQIFNTFLNYRKELLLLDSRSLTHLLLDEMNSRIAFCQQNPADEVMVFYTNYHIGGVFNSFCFWLRENMATPPEQLADRCLAILPEEFSPKLAAVF